MKVKAIKNEVYSRVCGYFRPVESWHKSKQREFELRAVLSNIDIERAVNNDERSGTIETNE